MKWNNEKNTRRKNEINFNTKQIFSYHKWRAFLINNNNNNEVIFYTKQNQLIIANRKNANDKVDIFHSNFIVASSQYHHHKTFITLYFITLHDKT